MREKEVALRAAKEAGNVLLAYFGNVKPRYKEQNFHGSSIYTKADLKAEQVIASIIRKAFPTHGFFSEEKVQADLASDFTWYVDPLDGTANFSRNIPIFGTSIGLLYKDRPILGVLHFPALKTLVVAEKNNGTLLNGKRVSVSKRPLEQALYFSPSTNRKGTLQYVSSIGKRTGLVKIFGSAAYELTKIAQGDGEIYIYKNVLHDVVAGILAVEEAGGKVTDFFGDPWSPTAHGVVATNGCVHDDVIRLLKRDILDKRSMMVAVQR